MSKSEREFTVESEEKLRSAPRCVELFCGACVRDGHSPDEGFGTGIQNRRRTFDGFL
jgi:hypothetical protein